jgi:oligoendopeptidase F
MIETERTDRQKEIKATAEEAQRAFETKLAPLEQRIIQHTDQRIIQHIEQCSGRTRALSEVIATERAARQKEVQHVVEEQQRK